ncbi:NAD(P)H-quinone oxidoreductase subunit H [bacterium BMS3Abin05]|nr:NAD(P)H-quinone oxidoreductase subunit H [bacterium BMS3Abin05]GBE27204.1 NAD(P)H-quinone oxidoreductase subunit H [bacterium BMS3Bbin03]
MNKSNLPPSRFELEVPNKLKTEEMTLSMGPQHPSTHGVLQIILKTDGEIIDSADPRIGYLHRCFEKHAENVTWHQVIPYTDRLDYIASMNNNLGYVIGLERMMKLEVNERAEHLRVIVAELNRIASHLIALGTYGLDIGAFTPFLYTFRDRERILDLFEEICGARLLYNYIWVGGVAYDALPGWRDKVLQFCDYFLPKIKEYNDLLTFNKIFIDRTANVGVIPAELAINYGMSGPGLRGSGVPYDLRKIDPYSIYDRFEFDICTGRGEMGTVGDCWDRYWVRVAEMYESVKIIRQACEAMPDGDAKETVPRNIKVPAGEYYMHTESPRGELGYYIISDGGKTANRIKVRSPAYSNLSILSSIAPGVMIADLVAIIGSLDIVLGEIDR